MGDDDTSPRVAAEGRGRYAAFLLRVWRSEGEPGDGWRIVIEAVGADERHGFTDWHALVQHVCDSLAIQTSRPPD